MNEYTVGLKYTSIGDVTIKADSYEEAVDKAERQLVTMQSTGSIMTDRQFISWSGDELEVDGEEIDLDDMRYFEETN